MFGSLFGKKPQAKHAEDQVWLSAAARRAGMQAAIEKRLAGGKTVMLICTGNDAFDAWAATLDAREPFHCRDVFGRNSLHVQLSRPGALILALASSLPGEIEPSVSSVDILVHGRHAARSSDDALRRFADLLGMLAAIEFHLSMDDALLATFADRLGEVLQRLGAKENEAMSNTMITRAIANAQGKHK